MMANAPQLLRPATLAEAVRELDRLGRDGAPLAVDFESYRLPTAFEAPPIEIALTKHADPNGPCGAQGIAEPPILPVAAVANPIADVLAALRSRNAKES